MRRSFGFGVLLGGLFLAACSSIGPRPQELPVPTQRIFQNAYSFMPPNEMGWFVAARDPHQLALGRYGINPDETFGIRARLFRIPPYGSSEEFVRIIKDGEAADTDPKRYKILKHEVGPDTSKQTSCARLHVVVEDNAAVKRTSTPGVMIREVMALSCAHPKNRTIVVNLYYAHQYYPGQADARFTEKAAEMLSSMEFLE